MQFPDCLIKAKIENCYKNLILDIKLPDASLAPILCLGDNKAKGIYLPRNNVYVSKLPNPKKKIEYELFLVEHQSNLIMPRLGLLNRLFVDAFNHNELSEFAEYASIAANDEAIAGADFVLTDKNGKKCYVCISSIYEKKKSAIVFPTAFGLLEMKKIEALRNLRKQGHKTAWVMLVPRSDCFKVAFSWTENPTAAGMLFEEAKNGLDFVCYGCNINQKDIQIAQRIKIDY